MSFITELKRRNVIRIAIAYGVLSWVLLQVSDVLTNMLGLSPTLGKTMLALLAIGVIPTLIFSWVYELTPEGLKRESEITPDQSITSHTAKRLDMAVIGMLVLAIGLLAADRFVSPRQATADATPTVTQAKDASIAVLPFLNLSNDPDNEYFSDGLTETLLHMLAQVKDIRVAARSSAFAFKGTNTDVRQIAQELNVATILEGSVQRAGDKVRVTAQLIDAQTGSQIWSRNFDQNMDDIFAIQDEIANAVASALSVSLLGKSNKPSNGTNAPLIESLSTRNTEAYEFYLRGLSADAVGSHVSLPKAEAAYTEALLLEPTFHEARLALATTYLQMGDTALIQADEAVARARAALRPLSANSNDDPVVAALLIYTDFLEVRGNRFIEEAFALENYNKLTSIIAKAPNHPVLYIAIAEVLEAMPGRGEEQLLFIDRGLEIDPFNANLLVWRGRILAGRLDRFADALLNYARLRKVAPNNPNGYALAGFIHVNRGQYVEAFKSFATSTQIDRRDHELAAFTAFSLMSAGLFEHAGKWVTRAELLDPDGGATLSAKLLHLHFTGQRDEAFAVAERVVKAKTTNRRGAYDVATSVYSIEMAKRERTDELFDLFETLAPGSVSDPAYDSQGQFALALFIKAQRLKADGITEEEIARWREVFEPKLNARSPKWREDSEYIEMRYFYRYENLEQSASQLAARIVDEHTYGVFHRLEMQLPGLEKLYAHPQVQAAISKAKAHNKAQGELILAMIESGEVPDA